MLDFHMKEAYDIEEKTRLSATQFVAWKTACAEVGIKRADVMRALIIQFVAKHHRNQSLQAIGLGSTDDKGTE